MKNERYAQLGILQVLLIMFITLKLVGVVTWSWWIVLIPFWAPILAFLVLSIIVFISKIILQFVDG